MTTQVRIATRADEDALCAVCRQLHDENGLFEPDEGLVRAMLARAFDRKGGIIGIIDGPNGRIDGAIYMLISNCWYTRDNHLEELFSWVRPECRKQDHAATLIEFAKDCAVKIGIPLIIGIMTNKRMAGKVRLYRRRLGYPSGAFFVFNGKWTVQPTDADDFWQQPFGRAKANGALHAD